MNNLKTEKLKISHLELISFATLILKKNGCNEEEANIIAEVLVEAYLKGISGHGIVRLKRYIKEIKEDYLKGLTFHYVSDMSEVIDIAVTKQKVKNAKNL